MFSTEFLFPLFLRGLLNLKFPVRKPFDKMLFYFFFELDYIFQSFYHWNYSFLFLFFFFFFTGGKPGVLLFQLRIKGNTKVEEGLMVLEQELVSTVMIDIILLWTAYLKEEKNTMATWFPKSSQR